MTRPVPDTTVLRTLRRAGTIGVALGALVVLGLRVAGDSDSEVNVVVWGASLLCGIVATAAGLVFAAMARGVAWNEQRVLGKQHAQEAFLPEAVGLERLFLYVGVPLVVTGLMLSASLVLQGETLF